jgi:hypothetical protein
VVTTLFTVVTTATGVVGTLVVAGNGADVTGADVTGADVTGADVTGIGVPAGLLVVRRVVARTVVALAAEQLHLYTVKFLHRGKTIWQKSVTSERQKSGAFLHSAALVIGTFGPVHPEQISNVVVFLVLVL